MTGEPALDFGPHPPTLGDILRLQARAHPDREAMVFEGRRTSYADMLEQAFRVGNALRAQGLVPGDRIAILAKNSDRFFVALIAAAMAGVVLVPVNWRLSATEAGYILADSEARLLLVGEEFGTLAADAVAAAGTTPLVVPLSGGASSLEAWQAAAPADDPAIPVVPRDVVLQLYTSGTTGRPKGVLLTHHSLNCVRVSQPAEAGWCRWDDSDTCLVAMPLFHIGGVGTALSAIYNGARMVIAREFVPARLFDFIQHDGITRLFIVPAALRILLDDPQFARTDFSRLRYVIYGSSPITPQLLDEAMRRFGCPFVQVYGMTETSGTIVALPSDEVDGRPERLRAAGRPLRGVDVAILDAAGAVQPPGVVGEVAIRSDATMAGYWRQPAASAAAFTADGYLRSGDAGYLDEDGYLYIHDRVKDMIITGGENVYAVEVENALCGHSAVREAAVIGVPDDRWGEAVKAFVVLADGRRIEPEALRAWARERLAAYKIPKTVEVVDALPKNASGKILRRELRAPYWTGHARAI